MDEGLNDDGSLVDGLTSASAPFVHSSRFLSHQDKRYYEPHVLDLLLGCRRNPRAYWS